VKGGRLRRWLASLLAFAFAWCVLACDADAKRRRRHAEPVEAPPVEAPVADGAVLTPAVSVVDFGRVVHDGPVDIGPTLRRISAGELLRAFRHDGTVFSNREGALPNRPYGFYREYVHPTAGARGPGPQRVIVGRDGSVFYTPDHYATFYPIAQRDKR
jgi:guanyl-specific ribonuclease Sa